MELEYIKQYLRIDDNCDDILIVSFKKAAEEYLNNAGVTIDYEKELYKLAILMIILHWYENRGIVLVGSISKELERTLGPIILQLQLC